MTAAERSSSFFDKAFERLIGHEGKFTADPRDPGNWTGGREGRGELKGTKFGISAAAYPYLDIKNLTLEQAKAIYQEDYWDVIGRAHDAVKFQLFDAAVNHGRGNAIRILQRAVKVADDGEWGPRSQAALDTMQNLYGHNDVLMRFMAFRFKFWASLQKFDVYGRGWTNRGADNLLFAAEDN
jgi:lysozyme family protein